MASVGALHAAVENLNLLLSHAAGRLNDDLNATAFRPGHIGDLRRADARLGDAHVFGVMQDGVQQ